MDQEMTVGLEQELLSDLSAELSITDPNFNENLLLPKIRNAVREVKRARKYPQNCKEKWIENDLYGYFSNIRNIALYDYNQIGAEGQVSSNENGIGRTYRDRNELFGGIIPLSTVI